MSEELEVFERIKELKRCKCFYPLTEAELNTISKTFLQNEVLQRTNQSQLKTIDLVIEENHELLKYRLAVEAIKELILEDLVFDEKEQKINFSFGVSTLCIKIDDKAKYDFLKEVLL